MRSINIVGAGKVGKVFAKFWHQRQVLYIQQIINQHMDSARQAMHFIGAGQVCETLDQLTHANIILISVPDDSINKVATQLVSIGIVKENDIVMHCSGALSSKVLQPLQECGARTMSMHPPFSFADVNYAIKHLPGTTCVLEGELSACTEIQKLLQAIDLPSITIAANDKLIYHGALVMVSNYLVSLLDAGIMLLKQINITEQDAQKLMQPLVQGAVTQSFALTPEQALTGLIDRAEMQTIQQQLAALTTTNSNIAELYRALGQYTVTLAQRKHQWPEEVADQLRRVFES